MSAYEIHVSSAKHTYLAIYRSEELIASVFDNTLAYEILDFLNAKAEASAAKKRVKK